MSNKERLLKQAENWIVIIIWGVVLATPLFLMHQNNNFRWQALWGNWIAMIPFLILFILNHYILIPRFLFKGERKAYFAGIVFMLVIIALGLQLNKVENLMPPVHERPPMHMKNRPPHPPPHHRINGDRLQRPMPGERQTPFRFPPLLSSLLIAGLIIGFDTGLRMIVRWTQIERDRAKLEKESISNQLAFLKNQLSPHFFMNTLNNIHSLIDISGEEAKEAIIKLSKLMRHLLYESERENISLLKEVSFIEAYIDLMRLRFSEKVEIQFNWDKQNPDLLIPPLLFTSLLENAFKHGVSYENKSFIHISIKQENKRLFFAIENSNHGKIGEEAASGIGVVNTKQRLELLFPDNYTYEQNETSEVYNINLSIPV